MLLNVIFGFESGRAALMGRARLLLGLLISALRVHNTFSEDSIMLHDSVHHAGTFVPFVVTGHECWKRLVLTESFQAHSRKKGVCFGCRKYDSPLC